jgi:DNA-binding SARP family transcriptional activator
VVGDRSDVAVLRAIAKTTKGSRADTGLGRRLARRLADHVYVEDLGRLAIRVGRREVVATDVRRKVLGMLAYLVTKPRFSAARDEVIEALWPDLSPDVAVNSLNQTVYFLRRVFEPDYHESITAGYVGHDSDVLWLDRELITSRSRICRELLDRIGPDLSPTEVERLSATYAGRFALDFAYEDWAGPFREHLHASYLQVIESAVNRDLETGHYERGVRLARRALVVDPDSDGLELSLLRLYRAMGAHSAAAEQYAHYSAYLRDELGVDPPPLSAI